MKKKLKKKKGEEGPKVERQSSISSISKKKLANSPKKAEKEKENEKYSTHELASMNNLSRSYSVTITSNMLDQLNLTKPHKNVNNF